MTTPNDPRGADRATQPQDPAEEHPGAAREASHGEERSEEAREDEGYGQPESSAQKTPPPGP